MRLGTVVLAAVGALVTTGLGGATAGAAGTTATSGNAATSTAAAENLVKNPGFETGLSSWTCSGGSGSADATQAHSGTSALKATPAGADNARCAQVVSVQPNSDYELSAWVKGSYIYLGASGTGTADASKWTSSASDWTQLKTSFSTGPNTTSVTIYTHGWYGQPAYFADDVNLTGPGGPGPQIPAQPQGLAAGTVTPTSVELSWTAVPGAEAYNVYQGGQKVLSAPGASARITGLTPDTAYEFQVSAVNGAGESPKSATVSARTSKDDGGGENPVPKHAVTGYVQNFNNGAKTQQISDVPSAFDIIAVAFADSTTTPGQIEFNLDPALAPSEAEFKADIAAKKAAGKSVIISVGGELGNVSVADDASAKRFADSTYALMQEYGFDGVDIDLEHGINSVYMSKALRQLSAKAGSDLVITMAPQTLDMQSTGTEYFKLALNIKDILTVVNTQYYNSGAMLGCDQKVYGQGTVDFLTALSCIQLEGGLDPSQVGLGTPASSRAAGGGYVSPSVVTNALDCLTKGSNCGAFKPAKTYPSLRGAMTWSTNWDATNGNAWSGTVGPHVDKLP